MIVIHLVIVALTVAGFCLRAYWMLTDSPHLEYRLTRILPHVNDTALFASGVWLAVTTGQYPFAESWLTVKLLLLGAYIVLGALALRYARTLRQRVLCLALALACIAYIAAVALTRQAWPPAGL